MSILRSMVERRGIGGLTGDPVKDAIALRKGTTPAAYVTPERALQHTAVFACVRLISEGIASLPAHSYRSDIESNSKEQVNPQPKLLVQPHRDLTVFEWRRMVLVSMLLRGNAFGLIVERDRFGWPTQITLIPPQLVSCQPKGETWEWRVGNDRVYLFADGGDLVHFPAFQVPGSPLGLSPIQLAAQSIGVGLSAEQFGANWFEDGTAPSGMLTSEKPLDDLESRRLQAKWMAAHGNGSRYPAVLSGGVTWEQVTISPDESQFLETQRFSVAQIARTFGVPPHMIGDVERSTSWGTGLEQQQIGYTTHTLTSWISSFDARMTQLVPRGQYVRTNIAGMLRSDSKTRYESYVQARMAGWLSVNDIRALEELDPVEDGDGYLQPLNMGPLGVNPLSNTGEPDEGPTQPAD